MKCYGLCIAVRAATIISGENPYWEVTSSRGEAPVRLGREPPLWRREPPRRDKGNSLIHLRA
jgi:hypothetical protein